jgi:uncharacterized protein YneF (UPF0154 family)
MLEVMGAMLVYVLLTVLSIVLGVFLVRKIWMEP